VIFLPTAEQLEARETLRDVLGDCIAAAQVVRVQPNLTKRQRESVQWAIVAMLSAKRAMTPDSAPMPHEALQAAMEG
jgi:hypothetical protein